MRSGGQSQSVSAATGGHADISLSPILWHALDVWQCSKQGYESLHEAMEDLLNCSTEFDADNWYMSYVVFTLQTNKHVLVNHGPFLLKT